METQKIAPAAAAILVAAALWGVIGLWNRKLMAAGLSPFPLPSRVIENLGQEADSQNHLLMHAIAANVSGQIASVVAGGVVLQYFANLG